jgi:hypothetical protein
MTYMNSQSLDITMDCMMYIPKIPGGNGFVCRCGEWKNLSEATVADVEVVPRRHARLFLTAALYPEWCIPRGV